MTTATDTFTPAREQHRRPWPIAQGVAVSVLLLAANIATFTAIYAATDSLVLAGLITAVTIGLGTYSLVQCWRDVELGAFEYGHEAAVIGAVLGVMLKGAYGHAVVVVLAHALFAALANLDADKALDRLIHTRWLPDGAARRATAVTALDAAYHARELLDDPQTNATPADLISAFDRDMRSLAAEAVGERQYGIPSHQTPCCGKPTAWEPCAEHQPRLYDAHLEHLDNITWRPR
ncbi:MAG: hypothetical protein GEU83_20800 [Pseudonocardiaceae bacterium]|nr:hypothetical protein [Pseudonocardiaceae bacterium]